MADQTAPPPSPAALPPRAAPAAVWSLILAILSFLCGWLFTAIPAVICGHIARSKIRKSGGALGGMGIATAGLIIGYVAVAIGVMGIPLLASMIHSERERLHRLEIEKKEIVSNDGKLKVTTSGLWVKRTDLNKGASLQAAYNSKDIVCNCHQRPENCPRQHDATTASPSHARSYVEANDQFHRRPNLCR